MHKMVRTIRTTILDKRCDVAGPLPVSMVMGIRRIRMFTGSTVFTEFAGFTKFAEFAYPQG